MNDQALRNAVVWLYARDYGFSCPVPRGEPADTTPEAEAALRARCRRAIASRLRSGADLRLWTSRLARDVFLSDAALARGLGLEDVCDFWIWFDRTMWAEAAVCRPPTGLWSGGAGGKDEPLVGGRRLRA